jgi:hypothetical protein
VGGPNIAPAGDGETAACIAASPGGPIHILLSDREAEQRKRAFYRAGVLATGLEDFETAKKHLSALAGIDFGYRDVAARLDKLASIGDTP